MDGFPRSLGIKEITGLLCSVGFSSPPSWLKPFAALSTGEQFRVNVARTLAESPDLAVIDEFTSVVDRDVAQIASAAVQMAVRKRGQRLVAVTCHYDVAPWLEPDWIYYPQTGEYIAGRSLRRAPIQLEIARVHRKAWELFKQHHYWSSSLHKASKCFLGTVRGRPAVFTAVLSFPHPARPAWREHRTVCLPDFQGVGLGVSMGEYIASLFRATGKPYQSTTTHPGLLRHRLRSTLWRLLRKPSLCSGGSDTAITGMKETMSTQRYTAGFEYVGPPSHEDARRFGLLAT